MLTTLENQKRLKGSLLLTNQFSLSNLSDFAPIPSKPETREGWGWEMPYMTHLLCGCMMHSMHVISVTLHKKPRPKAEGWDTLPLAMRMAKKWQSRYSSSQVSQSLGFQHSFLLHLQKAGDGLKMIPKSSSVKKKTWPVTTMYALSTRCHGVSQSSECQQGVMWPEMPSWW